MAPIVDFVVGSYEKFVLGYRSTDNEELEIRPLFNNAAHHACVKDVAIRGQWLVTASEDETIRVFNRKRLREVGQMFHHEGGIVAIDFISNEFMVSVGSEGWIALWSTKTWEVCNTIKTKEEFVDMSIHPTGRLVMCLNKKMEVILYDLCTSKEKARVKEVGDARHVAWSPSGRKFLTVGDDAVRIFDDAAQLTAALPCEERFLCAAWMSEDLVACGGEDLTVSVFNVTEREIEYEIEDRHEFRIKDIAVLPRMGSEGLPLVATVSSDGMLRIFDVAKEEMEFEIPTGGRLTCVAAGELPVAVPKKETTKEGPKKVSKKAIRRSKKEKAAIARALQEEKDQHAKLIRDGIIDKDPKKQENIDRVNEMEAELKKRGLFGMFNVQAPTEVISGDAAADSKALEGMVMEGGQDDGFDDMGFGDYVSLDIPEPKPAVSHAEPDVPMEKKKAGKKKVVRKVIKRRVVKKVKKD